MKQLQNNFTTPEQSKRLMEIGVPADSADCYIGANAIGIRSKGILSEGETFSHYSKRSILSNLIPCWSVGRLIEIYNITTNLMPGMEIELNFEPQNCTYIELVIAAFELAADDGLNDFSRLKD